MDSEKVRIKNLLNQRFGKLLVCEFVGTKNGRALWLCKCDCGKEIVVPSTRLLSGNTKTCGCSKDKGYKHGQLVKGAYKDRLYKLYRSMVGRCIYDKNPNFHNYGGRGISVCKEWVENYEAFRNWAMNNGYDETAKYGKCSIDRIDVNGNYEPNNCKFVSFKEQLNNTRKNVFLEYNGEKHTIAQWAEKLKIHPRSLWGRLHSGWSIEKALSTPIIKRGKKANG